VIFGGRDESRPHFVAFVLFVVRSLLFLF